MSPTPADIIVREGVNRELNAMQSIGLFVPVRTYQMAERLHIADYVGMSIPEIADVLVQIAQIQIRNTPHNQGATA